MWERDPQTGGFVLPNKCKSHGQNFVKLRARLKQFEADPHCRECRKPLTKDPSQRNRWNFVRGMLCCLRCGNRLSAQANRKDAECSPRRSPQP